jgi:hypothetical protein
MKRSCGLSEAAPERDGRRAHRGWLPDKDKSLLSLARICFYSPSR